MPFASLLHRLRSFRPVLLTGAMCFHFLQANAQPPQQENAGRVEILNADALRFDNTLGGAQRLNGQVRLRHGNALMFCDSAYLFSDQRVEAFGQVRIEQGDSLRVTGDQLTYSGAERLAHMRGNVRLTDTDMELTTPTLDYDLRARTGVYREGGRIVSTREGNVLTSRTGQYIADAQRFIFSRDVRLDHPERTIVGDSLHYTTATGIADFFGPTTITQGATVITTRRGAYDTRNELAVFSRRSRILSQHRTLEGDSLRYDRNTGIGLAWGNVAVTDSSGDMRVEGDHGRYREKEERSMITGRAELILRMGTDTLFLHADTLFTVPDSIGKRIIARRHVRFFRSDLQGVCDTLVYSDADSLIRMFHQPALWSGTDQITGDRIRIALQNGQAHRLEVDQNAFLISQVDSIHLDQVTGTTMVGYFADNELRSLVAEGNSRTVYFAKEMKDGVEQIMGVNRADCSRITVVLADGEISTVSFQERPDAVLYPLEKAPPEELRMKGAEWRGEQRPVDRADIFR